LPSEKVDILITETTYGATDSSELNNWDKEVDRLASSINKIIINGGSILIPVFALGKLQEMLATIWLLMQQNKITQVDIYTGGIGKKINRIYDYNRFVVNRYLKDLMLHDIPQKDLNELKDPDELFKFPCIVLASSGMMIESTNSYQLANRWLHKKDSAIFTVGYMDPSTPGNIIANSRKGDKIQLTERAKKVEVKCEIKNFRFSAHSKREEILSLVNILNPSNILLVHGESEAIDWIGDSILKEFFSKKVFACTPAKTISFD
jgi:predicted metal-dependent RNase